MLCLIQPKFFAPIHGEKRHLMQHAQMAEKVGVKKENIFILNNGDMLEFNKKEAKKTCKVQSGDVLVDGLGVGDVGNIVLKDRKHLSEDGIMIIVIAIDKSTGKVSKYPEIVSRGFVYVKESEELMIDVKNLVINIFDEYNEKNSRDWNILKSAVREELRSFLFKRTNRNPMILPILIEV